MPSGAGCKQAPTSAPTHTQVANISSHSWDKSVSDRADKESKPRLTKDYSIHNKKPKKEKKEEDEEDKAFKAKQAAGVSILTRTYAHSMTDAPVQ